MVLLRCGDEIVFFQASYILAYIVQFTENLSQTEYFCPQLGLILSPLIYFAWVPFRSFILSVDSATVVSKILFKISSV